VTTTASLRELDALIDDLTVDAYNDEEQLSGFLVGAEEALNRGELAWLVGVEVKVVGLDVGPDARTGLTALVRRDDTTYEVALADLTFAADSQLGRRVAAYRRWHGRTPERVGSSAQGGPRVNARVDSYRQSAVTHCGTAAISRSGSPSGVSRSIPISSRSSRTAKIRARTGIVGMWVPLSSLEMNECDVPARSATCCWVSSSS